MAKFDEFKVINALNKDKAEVGKRYWYADYIGILKERVESDDIGRVEELIGIDDDNHCCFDLKISMYEFLYPYEEPPKQRMTNRQLAEYLRDCSKEYRECLINNDVYSYFTYHSGEENIICPDNIKVRSDYKEWVYPLVDLITK